MNDDFVVGDMERRRFITYQQALRTRILMVLLTKAKHLQTTANFWWIRVFVNTARVQAD